MDNGLKQQNKNNHYIRKNNVSSFTSIFYKDDVVNIFCDASTTNISNDGRVDACSGYVAICSGQVIDEYYHCIDNTNSSFAELDALRLAISYAISAARIYRRVNIFSDYQAGVFGIRNWICRWRLYNGNIMGSKIIMNQQIYLEMATLLLESGVSNIAIYHQKGHVEMNCSDRTLYQAQRAFILSNGTPKESADLSFIRYISTWNSYVDKATRRILTDTELNNIRYIEPLEFSSANFNQIQRQIAPVLNKIKQNMYLA